MFRFDGEKGKHNDALKIPPTSINLYTQTNKEMTVSLPISILILQGGFP